MPTVKTAKLDKNCEGCQAAKRAIEGYENVICHAKKKIQSLQKELEEVTKERDTLRMLDEQSDNLFHSIIDFLELHKPELVSVFVDSFLKEGE